MSYHRSYQLFAVIVVAVASAFFVNTLTAQPSIPTLPDIPSLQGDLIIKGADGNLYVNVPLPAHVASQMQAAAEKRADDVANGAALDWGTAQLDQMLGKLAREHAKAVAAASDPLSADVPPLIAAPGVVLDEETIRRAVQEMFKTQDKSTNTDYTIAFRKNSKAVMEDALVLIGALQAVSNGKSVDWENLHKQARDLVANHPRQLVSIFVGASKAVAQAAASETPGATLATEPASVPASATQAASKAAPN